MNFKSLILFVVVSLIMTILLIRRIKASGCFSFAYLGAIIFSINALTFVSYSLMYNNIKDLYTVTKYGKTYTAIVTDHEFDSKKDGEAFYIPIVTFTADGKQITQKLDFSTSGEELGKEYKINYNKDTKTITTLGFHIVIKTVGIFIFFVIFSFLFVGLVLLILDKDMSLYKHILKLFGTFFFLPFLMIGFDALLVYSLFYGNKVPFYVTAILIFFIFSLTAGIIGYFKYLFKKENPT